MRPNNGLKSKSQIVTDHESEKRGGRVGMCISIIGCIKLICELGTDSGRRELLP